MATKITGLINAGIKENKKHKITDTTRFIFFSLSTTKRTFLPIITVFRLFTIKNISDVVKDNHKEANHIKQKYYNEKKFVTEYRSHHARQPA